MASYFPPEQNLPIFDPSVFKRDSETLTIAQADARYCRFNTAQGTMNFSNVNVSGDASLNQDVSVAGTLTTGTIASDANLDLVPNLASSGIRSYHNITMSSTAYDKRQMFASYYNLTDGGSTQTAIIQTGRIFSLGGGIFFDLTIANNSSLNFLVRRANINYTPLVITENCNFKTNIVQDTPGSIINQTLLSADITSLNTLKNTQIVTNFGGTSPSPALDVYDIGGSRGIRICPFVGNGAYLNLTKLNDSVIIARFRPTGQNVGLVVGIPDSTGTGIRFSSETSSKGKVEIRAGGSNTINILDDSDVTNPNTTTFNQKIRMIGNTTDSRTLNDVSILNMATDGSTITGSIAPLSSGSELSYKIPTANKSHGFYTNDIRRVQITDTSLIQNIPTDTTDVTTFTDRQNGFTDTYSNSYTEPSTTAIANKAIIILEQRGTYMITLNVTIQNTNLTGNAFAGYYWGLSENFSLPTNGLLVSSYVRHQKMTLDSNSIITNSTSCIFRSVIDFKTIRFNGFVTLSGISQVELSFTISWVKIA